MKVADTAVITMVRPLIASESADDKKYICLVAGFDEDAGELRLILKDAPLYDISLDALYECGIKTSRGERICTGRVVSRANEAAGAVLKFRVENGFYQIIQKYC